MLHIALVHNVSTLHEGLNLYNSGFSTGFVAGILVPILDNFTAVREKERHLEKELSKRIIDELLTYLYSHEITEIRIGVELLRRDFS